MNLNDVQTMDGVFEGKGFSLEHRPFYCHASGTVQSVAQTGVDPVRAKGGKSEN
ncbi:MAG: hypothetical protein HFI57_14485 [Lachnospiraceae bacterium]|nr:hypothetical protein [Lachnospiraceae bacterium]